MTNSIHKKILFSDNSLHELLNFRGDVIEHYASEGFDVVLVAPQNQEYHSNYPNIRYIPVDLNRSGMNPWKELWYLRSLYRIYRKERPDYIFHYTIKPNIYGSIAARLCGIPSTAMIAGLGYVFNKGGIGNWIARLLYRFAMRFPEHVFVLNRFNQEVILREKIARSDQVILLKGGEGINLSYFQV